MTNIAKPIKTETSLYLSALSELVGEPTNIEKSIKAEGGVTVSTLSALAQNKIVQFSNEASIEKIRRSNSNLRCLVVQAN